MHVICLFLNFVEFLKHRLQLHYSLNYKSYLMDSRTKFDQKQLRILERIGDGGQGCVYSAVYKGEDVVVKTSHDNDGSLKEEHKILRHFNRQPDCYGIPWVGHR